MEEDWTQRRRGSVAGSMFADRTGTTWQEFTDEDGNIFYYNIITGISQWERPEEKIINMHSSHQTLDVDDTTTTQTYTSTNNTDPIHPTNSTTAATDDDDNDASTKKKRRKPRRLMTRLSTRAFRVASSNNRCYTMSPWLGAMVVVIFVVVTLVLGSQSKNVLGIPWENSSEWTLALIGISIAVMLLFIFAGCCCFRFKLCESWTICQMNSTSTTPMSEVDIKYDEQMSKARAHLKDEADMAKDLKGKGQEKMRKKLSLKHDIEWKFEQSAEALAKRETAKRKRHSKHDTSHHHHHEVYVEGEDEYVCTISKEQHIHSKSDKAAAHQAAAHQAAATHHGKKSHGRHHH